MSYLDRLRAREMAHRPPTPTDKTDETHPASGIGGSVGIPGGHIREIEIAHRPPTPTDRTAETGGAQSQCPAQGTDKTAETEPAQGIGGSVGAPGGDIRKIEGDRARPMWRVVQSDGQTWVSCFAPAATLAEVLERYPQAQAEPVPEPDPGDPLDPETQARILGWLDALGEDCPQTRREVLQRAQADPEARARYLALAQAATAPRTETPTPRPEHRRGTSDPGDRPC